MRHILLLSLSLLFVSACNRIIDLNSMISRALDKAKEIDVEVCQEELVCRNGRLQKETPDGEGGCRRNVYICEYGCSKVENGNDTCNPKPPPPVCNTQAICKNNQMVYEELDEESNTCIEKVQETCTYGCTTDACDPEPPPVCNTQPTCKNNQMVYEELDEESNTCIEKVQETCTYGCSTDACDPQPECSSEITYRYNEIWGQEYSETAGECQDVLIESCIFGISENGTCNTEKNISPFPDHSDERFRGLYNLIEMAERTGKDIRIAVSDVLGGRHGDEMQLFLQGMNIPDEKMIFVNLDHDYSGYHIFERFFISEEFYPEAEKIRVVAYPHSFPGIVYSHRKRVYEFLENTNALHFVAAGNDAPGTWSPEENDYFYWGGLKNGPKKFQSVLGSFDTGKVFIVRTGVRNPDGTVDPAEETVNCNDAAYACFTTLSYYGQYSSEASVKMAGLAYYLSHLFDRAEDVAQVLKDCSDDLGEPGVDRIFGLGVPNMDCDLVRDAEVETASAKVTVEPASSHALNRMFSNKNLSFFYSTNRATGHVGKSVSMNNKTDMILLGGKERYPLGIETESQKSSFFEVGMKRHIKRNMSAVITYGQLWDKNMSTKMTRIGTRYTRNKERYNLSIYTGYYHLFGKYGFPQRKTINRERVPFNLGSTEVRTQLFFRF